MNTSDILTPLHKKMQERSHLLIQGQIMGVAIQLLETKLATHTLDQNGHISVTAKEIALKGGMRNRLPAIVSAMKRMEEVPGWAVTGKNSQTTLFLEQFKPAPQSRPLESVRMKNKTFTLPSRSANALILSTIHTEGSSNALHYLGESLIDGRFENQFYPALNTLVQPNLRANPHDAKSMINLLDHLGITCADVLEEMQVGARGLSSCQNSDLVRGKCEAFDFKFRTADIHRFLMNEDHNIRFIAFAWGPLEHLSGALRQEIQDLKSALRFTCPHITWIENELPAFDATKMADAMLGQKMRDLFQLKNAHPFDDSEAIESSFRVTLHRSYRDLGFVNVPLHITQDEPMLFPLNLEPFDYEIIVNGSKGAPAVSGEGMIHWPTGPNSNVRLALFSRFVNFIQEVNLPEQASMSIHVVRKPGERLALSMSIATKS